MLERLNVSGFAVARSVVVELSPGLNVFTGETGAGKSLVVGALAFVFGARRGREVIASGAERATVEALLTLGGERVTIERSLSLSGRSTARLNGEGATVERLQALAGQFVDIHGQSEQIAILRPAVQLAVLDEFAGLASKRQAVTRLVREVRETRRRLRTLVTGEHERERLAEQLRFETAEIAEAGLVPGEDETLRQEHARLANAGRLLEDATAALEALEAPAFGEASAALASLLARDPGTAGLTELATALDTATTDLGRGLRRYRDGLEENPERLAAVEERLDRLARLKRKFGDTVDAVIAYGQDAARRLAELESGEADAEVLRGREASLLGSLAEAAAALSRDRRSAAGDLVHAIAGELGHLGMGGATLSVGFACDDDPEGPVVSLPDYEIVITHSPLAGEGEPLARAVTEGGVDRVEFLASFNPGEAPRSLAAVASGGETSRFLLALTTVLGSAAEPRLVVFDEVDEGVGGRAGRLVGEALARLAQRHQVLCVTHLPQVAAFATRHFTVTKQSDGSRTWSDVAVVEGDARVDELAAMLGGLSEGSRQAAREMLDGSRAGAT